MTRKINIIHIKDILKQKGTLILLFIILLSLIISLLPIHYGYFGDELYYIALSKNIAFGYVDVPPLMPFFLAIFRFLFGDSLFAIHLLAAITGIITLIITSITVKKMGGGLFAQSLALIALVLSPMYVSHASLLTYDCFNNLFWVLAIYFIVLLLLSENKKYWIYFGVAAGFGLLSKFDILWLGAGLTVALLFVSQRKYFRCYQFWLGGVIALLIASPYLIWIATHDFLTIEYFAGYSKALAYSSTGVFGFWQFIKDQIIVMNPLSFPIWAAGLYYFIFNKTGRRFRLIGLTYIFILILCLITHVKFYFITPFYFVLLAGGSIFLEKMLKPSLKTIYFILIIATGLMLVPYMRPVLPPNLAGKYIKFLGKAELTIKYDTPTILPQWFADTFGWKEMTADVAQVYYSLPPDERAKTVILTRSYSQASAIYFYSKMYKLPIPISGHDQYYVWGPRNLAIGSNVIIVGYDAQALKSIKGLFAEVSVVGKTYNKYTMTYNNKPIYLGKGFKKPVKSFWIQMKNMTM